MFLATLGMTKDKSIATALQKTSAGQLRPCEDLRGCHEPSNKTPVEVTERVKSHIMSFNPCISHYRREHAPNRLYISPEFSITTMHQDFCESNIDLSIKYGFYRTQIASMNIDFVKLGEEECEGCDLHDIHLQEFHEVYKKDIIIREEGSNCSQKGRKQTFENCEICDEFTEHITLANEGRNAYRLDKKRDLDANEVVFSVDMQKVIMLPRMPGLKVAVFCKRIVIFNETFAPVGGKSWGKPNGVLWHEGIAGRSAQEVASTYIKLIRSNRDKSSFVFWADNCSAQNKNWYLYTALATEVNRNIGVVYSVTIKYFEPGHTFMSADVFHHQIGQGMREKKRVEDFQDFQDIVTKKGKSLLMEVGDFLDIPKGISSAKFAQLKPNLNEVFVIKFERGTRDMFWKEEYQQENFKRAQFLQNKYQKENIEFASRVKPRGVRTDKKHNIIEKLCPHMKENRREFWEKLDEDENSPDLVKERDPSETAEVEVEVAYSLRSLLLKF